MDSNNLIEGLLQKPLWQMTGEEYCQLKEAESSALPSSPASGDGLSLTSRQPAGWPTITNRPANNLRVKREIWCTMGSACEGASYRHI